MKYIYIVTVKAGLEDYPDVMAFKTKKAIFDFLGENNVGLTYNSAKNINMALQPYENRYIRIEQLRIITSDDKIDNLNQ